MTIVEFEARSERLRDDGRVVWVAGELDLYTAPELERALLAAAGDGAGMVVVDFSGCTFVDSSAVRVLVEANRRLEQANGTLKIVAAAPAVRRPFELTGLDGLFDFYPSRTAALGGES